MKVHQDEDIRAGPTSKHWMKVSYQTISLAIAFCRITLVYILLKRPSCILSVMAFGPLSTHHILQTLTPSNISGGHSNKPCTKLTLSLIYWEIARSSGTSSVRHCRRCG